jgi:hypothetical protein
MTETSHTEQAEGLHRLPEKYGSDNVKNGHLFFFLPCTFLKILPASAGRQNSVIQFS